MGLSQLAAAVLATSHIALLEPGAIGDVRELVCLIFHFYAASSGWPQKMPSASGVRSSATVCIARAIAATRNRSWSAVRTEVKRTGLPVSRRTNVMLRSWSSVLKDVTSIVISQIVPGVEYRWLHMVDS